VDSEHKSDAALVSTQTDVQHKKVLKIALSTVISILLVTFVRLKIVTCFIEGPEQEPTEPLQKFHLEPAPHKMMRLCNNECPLGER
jgi:hypothetical protein